MAKQTIRQCITCYETKPLNEFAPRISRHNGKEYRFYDHVCNDCAKKRRRQWYHNNKEKISLQTHNKNLHLKQKILTYYGNGKCACVYCGFSDIRALSIDHIEGNGNKHRKSHDVAKYQNIYQWLESNKYPDGYQTLCMNCQFIKKHYSSAPITSYSFEKNNKKKNA